jgi:hypothetical protein
VTTSLKPAIGPVAGGTAVTLTGAGFDPNTAADFVNFDSWFPVLHGGHAQVTPQSVAPNSNSAQLQTPKSPLGGDGSGYANVSATVNQLQSTSVQFLYFIPGKPVLVITPLLCGGGQITANVYAADGTPVSVGITLTASYPAFLQSGGGLTQSIVTTSGQSVNFVGAGGTFTATNNQTSQNVTEILTVPLINPCTVGTILLPSILGSVFWNPGQFIGHGGPNCIVCGPGSTQTVIWTPSSNPITAAGSILIAGSSQQQIRNNFQVRTVGAEEFRNYVVAGTLAAVRNAGVIAEARATSSNLGTINFVGPAMAVERRHHRDDDDKDDKSKHKSELFKITVQIPKDGTSGQDYHVLHLVQINGRPCWTEAQVTSVSGHGGSVTVTTEETGVYALAQVPGLSAPAR